MEMNSAICYKQWLGYLQTTPCNCCTYHFPVEMTINTPFRKSSESVSPPTTIISLKPSTTEALRFGKGGEGLTSINRSKSASKFAKSSFRFLFSAIRACFRLSSSCLACSSFSRSSCSCFMRAIISSCASDEACSGKRARNSSSGMRGRERYL